MPSFRTRIALLSAGLAGAALIGFGAIAWWSIYTAKVSRLDAALETKLWQALPLRSPAQLQAYEATLTAGLGISAQTPVELFVRGPEGSVVYQSATWPTEIAPQNLWASPLSPPTPPPEMERPSPLYRHRPFPFGTESGRLVPLQPRAIPQHRIIGDWRVATVSLTFRQIAIAVNIQAIDQEMATIRNIFLLAIPGMLFLIAGAAWALAGRALQPIRRLTQTIAQVTAQGLDQRIPVDKTDLEFVALIQVFNQMMERLDGSFRQASRFSADAAHELKTPLAILQGELERSLQQAESGSETQQQYRSLLDEVQRLGEIVRKLLLLSLADAGKMSLHRQQVDLSELLTEVSEDISLLAPELEVTSHIAADLRVWGDRDLLVQVLQNLVSNAIKYNLPQGWIKIEGTRQGQSVVVTIANNSRDLLSQERKQIFERFFRGDPARNRQVEGTGLGLSLAWEITRAHGGKLSLADPQPGQTCLVLRLPIAP